MEYLASLPPNMTPADTQAYLQLQLQLIRVRQGLPLLPNPAPLPPPSSLALLHAGLPQHGFPQPAVLQPAALQPAAQSQVSSPPECPLVIGPLLKGVKHILSLPEAMNLLKNPPGHISDPAALKDAPGGTVCLFRSSTDAQSEDWRPSGLGHNFRQTCG